jgi:RNA recognition motif-containing protein
MFKPYGEIKSAKLSLLPTNHKSKGYGFIWFNHEGSTNKAIKDSSKGSLPVFCCLYKPKSLTEMTTSSSKSLVIKKFPSNFKESDLTPFFAGFG